MVRKVASPARNSVEMLDPEAVSPKKWSMAPCGKGARAGLSAASLRPARVASDCLVAIKALPGSRELPRRCPLLSMMILYACERADPMTRDRILVIVLALWGLA